MTDVQTQVLAIMSRVLMIDQSKISLTMTRSQCDSWDSLRHIELIVAIEANFDVRLSFEEISLMESFDAIVGVIDKKEGLYEN
jgi:acyl carrier protein